MNKTLILFALPTLFTACVVPNPHNKGAADDGHSETTGADAAPGESGDDESGDDDPNDDTDDGHDTNPPDPSDDTGGNDETDGGESSESGTVEPEPTCDLATHRCVSNVPDGWNGPVARIDAADPLGCHGDFADSTLGTYETVLADPATCTCECGPASGGTCANEVIVELYPRFSFGGYTYNASGCEYQPEPDFVLEAGVGAAFPSDLDFDDQRFIADAPAVTSVGSCDVTTETTELGEPELVGEMEACASATPFESCDEASLCVPKVDAPFEAGVCIWADGDVPCPAGTDFVNREVRSTGVVDDRACSSCACSDAIGQSCDDAEIGFWRAGVSVGRPADGTCNLAALVDDEPWTGLSFDPNSPSGGSCVVEGGDPRGGVVPENQITFCCA